MASSTMHEWLSFSTLVVVMGTAAILMQPLMQETSKPIIKDYADKTALDATGSIMMELEDQTGAAIMMALSNTDLNLPFPRAIRINDSPVLKLDNAFQADLGSGLAKVYSSSGKYKLKNMLDWKIIDVVYVYTTSDPKFTDIIEDMNSDSNPDNDNMYGYGYGLDESGNSVNGYWQYILKP